MMMVDGKGASGGPTTDMSVLDVALKALHYALCDRCLGRLFAKYGFGLTNEERGRAVRTTLALHLESIGASDEVIKALGPRLPLHRFEEVTVETPVDDLTGSDDGWVEAGTRSFGTPWKDEGLGSSDRCYCCQGAFERLDALRDLVLSSADGLEFSSFQIGCRLDPGTLERQRKLMEVTGAVGAEPLSEEMNREVGKRVHGVWGRRRFDRDAPEVTFIVDPLFLKVELQVKPLFVFGRYRKLVRGIPQTRWTCSVCGGKGCMRCGGLGKMYPTSVEELIGAPFMEAASAEDFFLHGMGREDIDVITVGNGRPFVLELSKPKVRTLDLDAIGLRVSSMSDGKVEVSSLRMSERSEIPRVKDGAHLKRYRAKVSFDAPVDEATLKYNISLLAQSPIKQRTPERVSHRRADKVRERSVHGSSVLMDVDGTAAIELLADGGLYIKELLHGDEGRTEPSLASLLGTGVKVLSLDVLEVLYQDGQGSPKG